MSITIETRTTDNGGRISIYCEKYSACYYVRFTDRNGITDAPRAYATITAAKRRAASIAKNN